MSDLQHFLDQPAADCKLNSGKPYESDYIFPASAAFVLVQTQCGFPLSAMLVVVHQALSKQTSPQGGARHEII